ncbi:MAG TPA: S9 family peptidase [Casimicrobiaceae bacterium]|nr:S9 family peptidase [Casimicrobiaceae bacterium]
MLISIIQSALTLAVVVGALGIVASSSAGAAEEAPIPVRDFFRHPERSNFRISPDGKTLAFLQPYERRMNIHVQPIAGGEAKRLTNETARDIPDHFWKGSDRLVYVKDFGGDENFHVVAVNKDGSGLKDLTPFDGVRAEIIDELRDYPDQLLVGLNKRNKEVFDAYRLDLKTGELELIAENPGNITSWLADHAGNIRGAQTTDGVSTSFLYRDGASGPFKTVLTTSFRDSFSPLFFTFDNKSLYAASNLGRDKQAIVLVDPATAKEQKLLFEHPDVDVDSLSFSHKRKVLTTIGYVTWKPQRKFLDAETEKLFAALEKQLPGYEFGIQSMTDDEDRFVVAAYNDRTPGARYLYDAVANKLTKLGEIAPWLPEAKMARMKPIEFKSRDGLTINGYITLPNGKESKNLPVIVNPHGGPWARDVWGWNPEVQMLANRGYAVLQMNFRGSTGYGRSFWQASFKQWGLKMQDDITDGVNYLVKEGIADPKRVCIYGGSYGGYATLAGVTYTPDLYACAVDYVGVSNLFTFLNTIPPYWKPFLDMMHEMVGEPEKDKALLTSTSPALNADKIKTPLFIAQGARDPRVNIDESNQMVKALKARGVDVPYMVKENEGHGFHNEENKFDFYEAMERFLAKYLAKG